MPPEDDTEAESTPTPPDPPVHHVEPAHHIEHEHASEDRIVLRTLVKTITNVKVILVTVGFFVAIGIAGVNLWNTKADAKDVVELKSRAAALEIHSATRDVIQDNMDASMRWQQDTLWKLSSRFAVVDVAPPPVPRPTIAPVLPLPPAPSPVFDAVPAHP